MSYRSKNFDPIAFSKVAAIVAALVLGAWGMPLEAKKKEEPKSADDLLIVDCLLPQKVRRLGRNNTYLAPRRPIRTTAVDCRIRGGEYTEPDQASYATSLKVWLPRAKDGDPEAQYYVGQIFEKGLGTTPDYESAAEWYRKAAEQEFSAAQIGLGYLYEEGLGVGQDDVQAMNWYRKAAGLAEDLVVLEQAEYDSLLDVQNQLKSKQEQVDELQGQVDELRRQLSDASAETEEEKNRQATLRSILERLEADLNGRKAEVDQSREQIASLEKRLAVVSERSGGATQIATLGEIPFGSYHALVIGNSDYEALPDLASAKVDAETVASLLKGKYGFEVTLLLNANRFEIMSALNRLRQELTSKDNLLVYYAGHGERDAAGRTAYWQPVDSDPRRPTHWIPSEVVTEHLDLIAANHVFVVADSVYSGLRTRSSVARLRRGMTDEQRYHHIKLLMEKRARLVLSSGGPGGGGTQVNESNFASAFVEILKSNDGVLEASRLYEQVNERLQTVNASTQSLEFATLKWARNDLADFFFVPAKSR